MSLNHIDGVKFCIEIINDIRKKYKNCGYQQYDLPIEYVLNNIENEIGVRVYKDWRMKSCAR